MKDKHKLMIETLQQRLTDMHVTTTNALTIAEEKQKCTQLHYQDELRKAFGSRLEMYRGGYYDGLYGLDPRYKLGGEELDDLEEAGIEVNDEEKENSGNKNKTKDQQAAVQVQEQQQKEQKDEQEELEIIDLAEADDEADGETEEMSDDLEDDDEDSTDGTTVVVETKTEAGAPEALNEGEGKEDQQGAASAKSRFVPEAFGKFLGFNYLA
ncbi:hypothetical protein B0H63DRAFT_468171 [Podospora didyma]|uniref:Uncharacterized protein n=1 Tax=Podospora didyma TaxID=330526 RepID=A0AAE0U0R2_9PEZI|nr:hypothetical protein B0H63DRAFT_468171 [Podospora didyma]